MPLSSPALAHLARSRAGTLVGLRVPIGHGSLAIQNNGGESHGLPDGTICVDLYNGDADHRHLRENDTSSCDLADLIVVDAMLARPGEVRWYVGGISLQAGVGSHGSVLAVSLKLWLTSRHAKESLSRVSFPTTSCPGN
jgi:hypothetical protein